MVDDEAPEQTGAEGAENGPGFDPTFVAPGPRRSTYTPPTGATTPAAPESHDDDALADALAADLGRVSTGTIPVVPVAPSAPVDEPTADQPPVAPPQPYTFGAAPQPEPPAWSTLPAPDPAQAVQLPDGPPVRRSLPDEELAAWVADAGQRPGGTLEVIEQLETQMRLREEEAREFRAWEDRMRSVGTPDASAAVDDARQDFTGVLPGSAFPGGALPPEAPIPPAPQTGSFFMPQQPVAAWPQPDFADAAATTEVAPPVDEQPAVDDESEAHEPAVEPPVEAPPLPSWGVAAPSPTWSPGPEYGLDPEPQPVTDAHQEHQDDDGPDDSLDDSDEDIVDAEIVEPEPLVEPAPLIEPAPLVEPAPLIEPERAPRAPFDWSATGPIATTASSDEPVLQPTIDPEPESPVESEPEPELEVEVEPDPVAEPVLPPPLVEPLGFGGPPILPSQTKSAPTLPPVDAPLDGSDVDDEELDPGAHSFDFRLGAPTPPLTPPTPFAFDDLLNGVGEGAEEPPQRRDPEPEGVEGIETLFIEPMPVVAGEPIPDTGTITVVDQAYDEDLDDDVDETDRAFEGLLGPVSVDAAGIAAVQQQVSPPSGPISTVRIPEDEQVLFDDEPIRQKVFSLEGSGLEPTPVDHRIGRAARLFWLWFAANSSILSLGLGAAVFAVGMSLRQSIVAVLAGVALSFIPLGLTTLAGKRSGQPTMVVSRATFGLIGNVFPAILALITRVFWGAVLLWLLASAVAVVLVGAQLNGALGEGQLLLISLAAAFLLALVIAFAGYPLLARIQLILSCISGVLVVGLIVLTWQYVDVPTALTTPDGPWLLTITGAVLVFSFVGLVWANSGADLARYQRFSSSGASSMLWATFGTTLPTFLLIAYGALLAASDKGIASGFLISPLDTLALMLPVWYPVPLVAATALSLLSGVILSLYSGGFALQAIGVRVKRQWSIVIVGVLLAGLAVVLGFGVTGINEVFRDVATSLAVPTAAWAGLFAAETMIRNRRFESQSLLRRGGVYADVRWVNLIAFFVVTAIGFALTTATVTWLSWQGYGFTLLGVPLDSELAGTDLGVLVALALGLLVPIVAGIPAIRKQEAMRV